ncbi:MAG: M20 family metallo-hydrolase [Alistipes sp.]|jgi:acetylornithine deacetylase|nr:M20 family metallo-hydrolase [Alistipes sp.]
MIHNELYDDAIALLCELIRTPSPSREEEETASLLAKWLASKGVGDVKRNGNNIWVNNLHFDPAKPTILLCSHHDTVRPSGAWTRDPFEPAIEEPGESNGGARLYGLGSNDAGASVVAMAAAFRHFYNHKNLTHNLILALVAEEEISGPGGLRAVLPELGPITAAIVGEPTGMQLAVAEKGLMVLDCMAKGRTGHAARDEGDNAIYHALNDIEWFREYRFPRTSPLFGDVKMSVTMIEAGTQHNVVPAECRFTVDVRVTEQYSNEEVLDVVRQHVMSVVTPRSLHLRSSSISPEHFIVRAGISLGMSTFGSPTTSDQVVLTAPPHPIPSVKLGPGQSSRSHTAGEYIELSEIEQGINLYIKLLDKIIK